MPSYSPHGTNNSATFCNVVSIKTLYAWEGSLGYHILHTVQTRVPLLCCVYKNVWFSVVVQVIQSSGAVWKSKWPSWAPVPNINKPTVCVDVKQDFISPHHSRAVDISCEQYLRPVTLYYIRLTAKSFCFVVVCFLCLVAVAVFCFVFCHCFLEIMVCFWYCYYLYSVAAQLWSEVFEMSNENPEDTQWTDSQRSHILIITGCAAYNWLKGHVKSLRAIGKVGSAPLSNVSWNINQICLLVVNELMFPYKLFSSAPIHPPTQKRRLIAKDNNNKKQETEGN